MGCFAILLLLLIIKCKGYSICRESGSGVIFCWIIKAMKCWYQWVGELLYTTNLHRAGRLLRVHESACLHYLHSLSLWIHRHAHTLFWLKLSKQPNTGFFSHLSRLIGSLSLIFNGNLVHRLRSHLFYAYRITCCMLKCGSCRCYLCS